MDSDARLAEMHEQLMQIRAASEVTEEKLRSEVRRNQQQMSLFCKVMFMWCYACHDDPMKWWRLHHVGGANHPWSGYIFLKFKCVLMCSSLSGARKGIPSCVWTVLYYFKVAFLKDRVMAEQVAKDSLEAMLQGDVDNSRVELGKSESFINCKWKCYSVWIL